MTLVFSQLPTVFDQVNYVFQILDVVVAIVGIVFNTLTFSVLCRHRLASISFSRYMRWKMVSDSFILMHTFRHFAAYMFDANIDLTSPAACILLEYSAYVASAVSLYSLTFNGLDRMLSIVYPNRFCLIKKPLFQFTVMVLVFLYGGAVYIEMPLYYRLIDTNGTLACVVTDAGIARLIPTIGLINLVVGSGCINNFMTIVTVMFIWRSRERFRKNSTNATTNSTAIRDRKFAINSIALDMMYFVCKTPFLVTIACSYSSWRNPQVMMMMFTVCLFIYTLESASAFFINYSVNSVFKAETHRMLGIHDTSNMFTSQSIGQTKKSVAVTADA